MSEWTSGYVADIGYTYGYYPELSPVRARFALLAAGLVAPQVGTACELGFGQGVSVNMHAAAGTQWWGTDFNPSQAALAREMAAESGAEAQLSDEAFDAFCRRPDLPDFDFIGLHGIWSWISDDNRRVIVDFVRRKLKVGGVLYVSYNTLPGWSQMVPVRHLMTQHADTMGAAGQGIVKRIDAALDFTAELLALNPAFARAHPQVLQRVKQMQGQNRHYLAHEYFNRDWQPMHFMDMAHCLDDAKLGFGCSAHLPDHIDAITMTTEQQQFLGRIPDPLLREAVRDFMGNTQFRRDYWVKGPRSLQVLDRADALRATRVLLVVPRASVELKLATVLGEANLSEAVYGPILDALAGHQACTLGEIEAHVRPRGTTLAQLVQAILILSGKGDVAVLQDEAVAARARPQCERLNRYLMHRARGSSDINYLVSPVTGGGVSVPRLQQLFLVARAQGRKGPDDWADATWQVLGAQGHRVMRDGKALDSEQDNRAELVAQARRFDHERIPILQALQIIP